MLIVKDLHTYHGRIHVLRGISMQVAEGEIVAIIGSNGAGKSTLMGALAGIYQSRKGDVNFDNHQITNFPAEQVVSLGINLIPERRQIFDSLSVIDNLLLGAYHRRRQTPMKELNREIGQILEVFPLLKGKEKLPAGNLSGGLQQMVAIGRGLMSQPRLLLLDEPSVGLAPLVVREIMGILGNLRKQGTTILLVEQNARAALKVADRGYVLEQGQIALEGKAEDLLRDLRVQSAYLGKGHHSRDVLAG